MAKQELLEIVKKWKINLSPEYRGFRCANCQKYIRKAFHHQLSAESFKTPVHFCQNCQRKLGFKNGRYKIFTCDKCFTKHFKMYHIWTKRNGIMEETHLCKRCVNPAGV